MTPTIWYHISLYTREIRPVSVIRETDKLIYIDSGNGIGRSSPKMTQVEQYHPNWEAAKLALVSIAEDRVRSAKETLEMAESFLDATIALEPDNEMLLFETLKIQGAAVRFSEVQTLLPQFNKDEIARFVKSLIKKGRLRFVLGSLNQLVEVDPEWETIRKKVTRR